MSPLQSKHIHFIGIGGIGMSGIAEILLGLGYSVSGSDLRSNDQTERLRSLGARVFKGHRVENLQGAEVAVFSSAVLSENPEMMEAKRLEIPLLRRAEMLAELMRKKRSIVVAGSHGKTTTSALVANMLMSAGYDPTAVIGGKLGCIASNAAVGKDEWFVAESDESDGSFADLLPTIGVITNVDREHLSHYGTFTKLLDAFVRFGNRVPFDGRLILCGDDASARSLLPQLEKPTWTYGADARCDLQITDVDLEPNASRFTLRQGDADLGRFVVPCAGMHNVQNSAAALAVGLAVGMTTTKMKQGLADFKGIDRRLQVKGKVNGITVVDDYAHHPTEILAVLRALRVMAQQGAVRVVFQPHRFSRMQALWSEFVSVFDTADQLVLVPVYAASEVEIAEFTSDRLGAAIASRGKVQVVVEQSLAAAVDTVMRSSKSGDLIVTMGAGDITRAADLALAADSSARTPAEVKS